MNTASRDARASRSRLVSGALPGESLRHARAAAAVVRHAAQGLRLMRPVTAMTAADAVIVEENREHDSTVVLERALALNPEWGGRAAECPVGNGDARLRFIGARLRIDGVVARR